MAHGDRREPLGSHLSPLPAMYTDSILKENPVYRQPRLVAPPVRQLRETQPTSLMFKERQNATRSSGYLILKLTLRTIEPSAASANRGFTVVANPASTGPVQLRSR